MSLLFCSGISLLTPGRIEGQGPACGTVLRPLPLFVAILHLFFNHNFFPDLTN